MFKRLLIILNLFLLGFGLAFNQTIVNVQVASSTDDAEEYIWTAVNDSYRTDGSMDIASSDIELGTEEISGKNPQISGLRFTNLTIPKGALITKAQIVFTVDATSKNEDPANYQIFAEDDPNPETFGSEDYNITNRTWLTDSVEWNVEFDSWNTIGEIDSTPDISLLVQQLINRAGWTVGNAMVFFIKGTGVREAESYDGSPESAAQLYIEYYIPTYNVYQIAASSDDAEEYIWTDINESFRTDGAMDLTSSDIELGHENQGGQNPQISGLRFTDIDIPAGSIISSAKIAFSVDATDKNEDPANYTIWAEANANPATFTSTDYDITSRTWNPGSVVWELPAGSWATIGEVDSTPDISALVESYINNPDWVVGNAMAFYFTGTGVREAESFDGNAGEAARLIIEYLQEEIIYKPELVAEIPDQVIGEGWGFNLNITPFFRDSDSELTFSANLTDGSTLPSRLSFVDGQFTGSFSENAVYAIEVTASSLGESVSDVFNLFIQPSSTPFLSQLGTIQIGTIFDEGAAEISAYDPVSQRLFVTNAEKNNIDIINFSDPSNLSVIDSIDIDAFGGGINSVDIADGLLATAIKADDDQDPGTVAVFDATGTLQWSVTVGALPDMLTFNEDGSKILVANEGEPSNDYTNDPEGTISIIDVATQTVSTADFTAFNGTESTLLSEGVRIFGPNATVAQDMEPEYITVIGDTAYVTCQENNAIAVVDIQSATVIDIYGLGFKDHSIKGNGIDASNKADYIDIHTWPVNGIYMPDAIAGIEIDGVKYIVTANEGDAREYDAYEEEIDLSDITLDASIFPNAEDLVENENLGKLKLTRALADTNSNGEYQTLYSFGTRSFSIWNAETGEQVYDSKDDFEKITASLFPNNFNCSDDDIGPKDRSDNKGPEPEALTIGEVDGRIYAFIGLERIGGIIVYDITDPTAPEFIEYTNNRNFSTDPEADFTVHGDNGPEGLIFIPASESPIGTEMLVVSNEVSGTVTAYSIGQAVAPYTLSVFHNNDGESDLLPDSISVYGNETTGGSISQFKYTLDSLRTEMDNRGFNSIMLSSGDNFLAGLEYNASQANGIYYDALALDALDYDAICLGNHDFDFGTQVLSEMINSFNVNPAPYLSSNLSFENVPEMLSLVNAGRVAPSTVLEIDGEQIGVVGLTTPLLPIISSPGNTTISEAIVDSLQKQVDILSDAGINKIILISHLQNYNQDIELAAQVSGVDIIIAGGGDELLSNNPNLGAPYNTPVTDVYPVTVADAHGNNVYIVTTPGGYRYLGNLIVDFNAEGVITKVYQTDPVLVYGPEKDAELIASIEEPIEAYIGDLSTTVIATVEDTLDYLREHLRGEETNGGNLFADAILWQAQGEAANFGVSVPQVALQNSGGLRIESLVMPGDFTEDLTYEIAAFTNIVSVVEDIEPEKFLELIEHGVAQAPTLDGRFPQISGFVVEYYLGEPEGAAGVKSIVLDDGTVIVENGAIADGAPSVTLATIDFTANGGDGYPFDPHTYTTLGATYQQAFKNYLTEADGLNGVVSAEQYPYNAEKSRIIPAFWEVQNAVLLSEDFNDCPTLPEDWTIYSVYSNVDWLCTSYGASGEDGDFSLEMNGYGADTASEDWLITPLIALDDAEYILNFSSMVRYSGPALEVLYSSDYDGTSNPNNASWTLFEEATNAVDVNTGSNDFVNSGDISLAGISENLYFAFKYISTGTGGGDGARYRIDNVTIEELTVEVPALTSIEVNEDFNGCPALPEQWTIYSVASNADWSCTSYGASGESGDYALEMNGYGADEASEDWLISPKMSLANAEYFLNFNSMVRYTGPALEILYSTDYTGEGDPNAVTWTILTDAANVVDNNSSSYDFVNSGDISLSGISGDVYIAFKYTSTGTSGGQGAIYRIDDVIVKTETLLYENFNEICSNANYAPEGWTVAEIGAPGIVICSSEGYENSTDDYSFRCNGYGVGEGEVWLITPELALGASEYEMSFASRVQYSGPMPVVLYSTDYHGTGDPNIATWTELSEASDAIGTSFSKSPKNDISFIGEDAYVAFKYVSEGSSGGQSRIFLLDEVSIAEPAKVFDAGDVSIAQIQGTSDVSPLENALVTTTGVVSKFFNDVEPFAGAGYNSNILGFFIQDTMPNDTASYGIFVYAPDAVVADGDLVEVSGKVTEYYGMTEINEVTSVEVLDSGLFFEPTMVSLPLDSADGFELYEGMFIHFAEELTVTENRNVENYGELRLSGNGMLIQPTQVVDPNDADPEGITANGNSNVEEVNENLDFVYSNNFLLDDARTSSYPDPVPYIDTSIGSIVAGSVVTGLTGVVTYGYGEYRIQPTVSPSISYTEREVLPAFEDANVKVAAFNVLNYFNGDGQGNGFPTSRGARTFDEFLKQTEKIVSALVAIDADVVGLMEIENDADDGYSAVNDLVDAINIELGDSIYSFVSTGIIAPEEAEADEIKVALIYKSNTVVLEGDYAVLTNAYDSNFNDDYNRPVLTQTFNHLETDQKFTVAVNHLKSKGSGCDDLGDPNDSDGQGNCNVTRTKATGTLASWLESDPTNTGVTDYLIIGDLNSYAQEDPIDTLRSRGFINLVEGDYSYLYDGQLGTLDYGMANESMNKKVTETFIWHINSFEPDMLSYYGEEEFYNADPYRSSDHDPVIVGLKLIPNLRVKDFILVDAMTDEDIMVLKDSTILDFKELNLKLVNIRTEIDSVAKKVFMILDGPKWAFEMDWYEPYTLFPERRGNYHGKRLYPGDYSITAYPVKSWFEFGEPLTVNFTVKDWRRKHHYWHKSTDDEVAPFSDGQLKEPVVYPVPFADELYIELYSKFEKDITIKLYNSLGNLVYMSRKAIYEGNNNIACYLPDLPQGVYFMKIDELVFNQTIVKE